MRVWFILVLALIAAALVSLVMGDQPLTVASVVRALAGAENATPVEQFIVTQLRLPRMVLAGLVGFALAVAGTATQAVIRNPLAEPGLLGVNAGAALAAMVVIVHFAWLPESLLPVFAFGGALMMSGIIFAVAWHEGISSLRLILIGIGLGAMAGACASFISVFGPVAETQRAMIWLSGSLADGRWIKSLWMVIGGVPCVFILWAMKHDLDLVAFGESHARALGQRVNLVRSIVIFASSGLAGVAVASAGPISFVGLVAPHIARRIVGTGHAWLIPAAGLIGAIMVILADLLARRAFAPGQLPVGLATAVLGAPFFGYLLWKKRHE